MTWLLRSGARTLRRERWPSRQVSPVKKRGRGASRLWTTWWLHPTGDALLMGLSRGLVVYGVTEEWTTQDLMNAVEADHQGLGLLSLPPDSQKNPGALLLHRIKRAITGKTPPAAKHTPPSSSGARALTPNRGHGVVSVMPFP